MQSNNDLEKLKEAQLKRIKRVVCSGGGAKGVVYPGSYKAMEDTGVFEGVEVLSGASAGAITSAMLAFGMCSSVFRDKLLTTNLKDLMGHRVGAIWGPNPPGIAKITKDGKPLENFIRENIIASVNSILGKTNRENLQKLADADSSRNLQTLLSKLATVTPVTPVITFRDLETLNRHFPNQFKQLNISAIEFPRGEVQIFNSMLTPDVEVALACRASASIPVILKPVSIKINDEIKSFVDGGMYDNLPTDYFDLEKDGSFIKNTIPDQTLVFAFGEGLNNESNQVFQALYGQRWDEVLENQLFEMLVNEIIPQDISASANKMTKKQKNKIETTLTKSGISCEQAKIVTGVINQLLLRPQDNRTFWADYFGRDSKVKPVLLASFIREKMKPVLYKAGVMEQFKRNTLVSVLGDLTTPYRNTDQKEIGYHRLRSEYALRTVELRVGDLKTTSFDKATKVARVMDALGYLDTINHITNHELHNPNLFNVEQFYIDRVKSFKSIYKAILLGASVDLGGDKLVRAIRGLEEKLNSKKLLPSQIARQVFQLIKDHVERNLTSAEAFALSRAIEHHNHIINDDELFKETYEESFKHSGRSAVSTITGKTIRKANTLHEALKGEKMFELYLAQPAGESQTRIDKVFCALENNFSVYPNQLGIDTFNAQLDTFCSALTDVKKKYPILYTQGESLLACVQYTANNPKLIRPQNLVELTKVLTCAMKTLQSMDNENETLNNVQELTKLSQTVTGKSSVWKKIGFALLSFACAALVCIGVLAAIPSGGSSLLLTAIGTAGLGGITAAGATAGAIVVSTVAGVGLIAHGCEKGLANEVSEFKTVLNEIRKDNAEGKKKFNNPK